MAIIATPDGNLITLHKRKKELTEPLQSSIRPPTAPAASFAECFEPARVTLKTRLALENNQLVQAPPRCACPARPGKQRKLLQAFANTGHSANSAVPRCRQSSAKHAPQ